MEMHAQIANNKVYPGILSSAEMADNSSNYFLNYRLSEIV